MKKNIYHRIREEKVIAMNDVIVKKSGKKGKGVFALKNFKKGELILKMDCSDVFYDREMDNMSWHHLNHAYHLGGGKNFRMKSPEKYINHSCNPNAFDRQGSVFAMKRIKKGEEINYDYSISGEEEWRMKCRCKSRNCRKVIYGEFSKLDRKIQKKYIPYLEKWYVKKHRKELASLK
jgi:hypothetical protein